MQFQSEFQQVFYKYRHANYQIYMERQKTSVTKAVLEKKILEDSQYLFLKLYYKATVIKGVCGIGKGSI